MAMKEILEALGSRIKSPVFGYSVLAFMAINWKDVFILSLSKLSIEERISVFDSTTDIHSLITFPLLYGASISIAYPWINLGFLHICKIPNDLRNSLQAQSEHSLLIKKQELEKIRSELLSQQEKELIEQAKRDVEVENIDNEEIREKAANKIRKLREEGIDSDGMVKDKNNAFTAEGLIIKYEELAKDADTIDQQNRYMEKAMEVREKLAFQRDYK